LRQGSGDEVAEEGRKVNVQWSLKRSNGYSIDSSAANDGVPFVFVVGSSAGSSSSNADSNSNSNSNADFDSPRAIPGLDEGIRGMRVGGIRRIVVPPALSYVGGVGDDSPGPVPPGFGPRQRIKRVMENRMDVPDESFLLDVKLTRVR
jgi:FKBP-type peptidyl-prolyl cis-trans isomerase